MEEFRAQIVGFDDGPDAYVDSLAFGDEPDGFGLNIEIQRGHPAEDPPDHCVVFMPSQRTSYVAIREWSLEGDELLLEFSDQAAAELDVEGGRLLIDFRGAAKASDVEKWLRHVLS